MNYFDKYFFKAFIVSFKRLKIKLKTINVSPTPA